MKIKKKVKIKHKMFVFNAIEMKEVKPGEIYDTNEFDPGLTRMIETKVRLPIHRDILNVRREGYRTRRPVSIRYKQKRLLALRSEEMRNKQRLEEKRRIEMEEYFNFQ